MTQENDSAIHAERVFVTAEIARQWLRKNIDNNRPLNQDRINHYARDLKAGRWKENGDTVKFADTGELIDGQHRLNACMQAGVGFWTQVVHGIKRDAFLTIDRNQRRTVGQVLHLAEGLSDYNAVAGTLTWLWRFKDGIMLATRTPTDTEAAELLVAHPQVRDSAQAARRVMTRFKAGPLSVVAVCHYLFNRQDATLAEVFFDALATGANLREVDPVFQLRDRIIGAASSTAKRIGHHELVALYFKAWQAEKEQRTLKLLRWMSTETFPNIGDVGNLKIRPEKKAGGSIDSPQKSKPKTSGKNKGTVIGRRTIETAEPEKHVH